MFFGELHTTIDGKGRTSIPAKHRQVLVDAFGDERFFVTKCLVRVGEEELCRGLSIYPYREFLALAERLKKGDGYNSAQLSGMKRLLIAPAEECVADRQGRVLIPPSLRAYADLERELVFVGMENKIDVWNLATWDKVFSQAEMDYLSASEVSALSVV